MTATKLPRPAKVVALLLPLLVDLDHHFCMVSLSPTSVYAVGRSPASWTAPVPTGRACFHASGESLHSYIMPWHRHHWRCGTRPLIWWLIKNGPGCNCWFLWTWILFWILLSPSFVFVSRGKMRLWFFIARLWPGNLDKFCLILIGFIDFFRKKQKTHHAFSEFHLF